MQVAFVDGHVEFVQDDVERCVWHATASRAGDGEFACELLDNGYYVTD